MAKSPPTRLHLKKQLHRLVVARSDVLAALEACKLLSEKVNGIGSDLYRPLVEAIVVSYARPFTDNDEVGSLPAAWTKFDNSDLQRTHKLLMKMRREFVAHSDPHQRSVEIIPPFVSIPGAGIHFCEVGVAVKSIAFHVRDYELVEKLCLDLARRLNAKVEQLTKDLYEDKILPPKRFPLTFDDDL